MSVASLTSPERRASVRARRRLCALASGLLLALACFTGSARAQPSAQQLAEANRAAMEAYHNLDVAQARAILQRALESAEKAGARGPALARTYANLAVVLVGLGDTRAAVAQFTRALREDPTVEPDPLVATPEVAKAYEQARAAARPGRTGPRAQGAAVAAPVEGNLDHVPAREQLVTTAIPVFVRKTAELSGATIKIFYRSPGMAKPRSADLQETDDGFTFLIPCDDVFEPVVEYFLVALDRNGAQMGNSGTPASPIRVPIVARRTLPPPSLPGQVPPVQCASGEEEACTPGEPGCGEVPEASSAASGGAGLGETCSRDADCDGGLVCSDDFCAMDERSKSSSSASGPSKRFFLELDFGVGATYVGTGRSPDHSTPADVLDDVTGRAITDGELDPAIADQELQLEGWDCDASATEMGHLRVGNCKVAVSPGGFVAVPVLHVAAGAYVTSRLALAVTGRIQLARGKGMLAGMLLGARAEYLLTRPLPTGFRVSLLGGVGFGQMQARPPAKDPRKGPFATHGALDASGVARPGVAVTAGLRGGYRFLPNLGFMVMPALHLGLPNVLFDLDVLAGVEVAF